MSNIIPLRNTGGFTRMDNDLYEALIRADLSGRELRVALAIHRYTAGFNVATARIPAVNIAKLSGIARENVSRIIGELIRQRVIYRDGGSKAPIVISPFAEWKIDAKNDGKKTTSKTTQSVKFDTSLVSFPTHIKDSKDNLEPSVLVDAAASTEPEALLEDTPPPDQPKPERIPFAKIQEIYNRVCAGVLPECLKLSEDRRRNIRKCWNLEFNGGHPFRSGDFWEGYFNDCLLNPHWTGSNDRQWRADIEFLTREKSVLKVLEAQ
jgi:phage replication O-like protein O